MFLPTELSASILFEHKLLTSSPSEFLFTKTEIVGGLCSLFTLTVTGRKTDENNEMTLRRTYSTEKQYLRQELINM
jgi:hypothetical protein